MGINRTNILPAEAQVRIWEKKLHQESPVYDCFSALSGVHTTDKKIDVGNEVMLSIEEGGAGGNERFHRLVLQKDLSGTPTEGSLGTQVGGEEDLRQKNFDIFCTDWSHAVSLQEYGVEAKSKDIWSIFEEITPKLTRYTQEYDGKYKRECLLERYSSNLTQAPHFLVQEFSPNIAIAGLHSSQWPVYNTNPATWTNRIGTALVAAGVGAGACATIRFIQLAEEHASAEKVIPTLSLGGKETYIVVLPSPQARYLKDPVVQGQLGRAYTEAAALTKEEMSFPGALGRVGRCLLVEDPRYPTLTLGGSNGGYSLTPQYRLAGRDVASDPRDKTLNARQVGYLMGPGAFVKWVQENFHWEYEYEQYKKFGGKGIFGTFGYSMVQWDFGASDSVNPPTSATRQQDSSMVLIFANPPLLS